MNLIELFLLALGLSMDAFAVSVCKGLAMKKITFNRSCIVGLWFGGFQALMPAIGFFLGASFKDYITEYDHWIAFLLLGILGINMIREGFSTDEERVDDSLSFKNMLLLAIATSIDALAVGVTFAFVLDSVLKLFFAVVFIGVITFALSAAGVKIGNVFGIKYKSKAEIFGGVILVFLGAKILFDALVI